MRSKQSIFLSLSAYLLVFLIFQNLLLMSAKTDDQSQRETYFHKFYGSWLPNQSSVRVPELVRGSGVDAGVCWQLVSHWIHVLAAVIPLPASGSGWCFSGREAEQKQAGSAGTGAEGAAGKELWGAAVVFVWGDLGRS